MWMYLLRDSSSYEIVSEYLYSLQIQTTWEEHFACDYTKGIDTGDLVKVMHSLMEKVKSRRLCSPGVPAAFRDFLVS